MPLARGGGSAGHVAPLQIGLLPRKPERAKESAPRDCPDKY
jgi:hypothetical protein